MKMNLRVNMEGNMEGNIKEILVWISPGIQEKQKFSRTTKEFLSKIKVNGAKAILGGSGAKGTWLSGSHDIDIYVLFDYRRFKKKSAELSDILEPKLKKYFKNVMRLHGSRDYFHVRHEGITFEIVPILKISKSTDAVNITDISPLHAKWVNKNVRNKDEVLLAKQFFKANRLYGAESHISGFSGYALEILIGHYRTFSALLKAARRWKYKEVIDVSGHYKGKDALFELNRSKTNSPLIIIDPVDKMRNASAALSNEKFSLLKNLAGEYLKATIKASKSSFFAGRTIDYNLLKKETEKKKQNLAFFSVRPMEGKDDVVGVKLLKAFEFLKKELSPFEIIGAEWDFASFYFILRKNELPKVKVVMGPPLKLKEHVRRFRQEHKKTFIQDGRIASEINVKNPKLSDFISGLLKEKYVRERVKEIKLKK